MTIEFICPKTEQKSSFPDAYAGVKYRCKFCTEFHTLPQDENYVNKDILAVCPRSDGVVQVDTSITTNKFKCAICGEIHEVPGEISINNNYIASSTKYQNQSRQKIIPSVRKKSSITAEENKQVKIQTGREPAVKTQSSTTNQAIYKTDRKKTEYKTDRNKAVANDNTEKRSRPPYKKSSPSSILTNLLLIMFLVGVGFAGYYIFSSSESNSITFENVANEFLKADAEANAGNFEKAIKLSENGLKAMHRNPQVKEKLNYKEFENKNAIYKKQKEVFDKIEIEFNPIVNNSTLQPSGIEIAIEKLQNIKSNLQGDAKFQQPLIAGIDKIRRKLAENHLIQIRKIIEKGLLEAEGLMNDQQLFFAFNKTSELQKLIQAQPDDQKLILTAEYQKKFTPFETKAKSLQTIDNLYEKSLSSAVVLLEVEKELRDLSLQSNYDYPLIKETIEQKLDLISERKKILEINKIDSDVKDAATIKKELLEIYNNLNPIDFASRKEISKRIHKRQLKATESSNYSPLTIEQLKLIAARISNCLIDNKDNATFKIEADKFKINWTDESYSFNLGLIKLKEKNYYEIARSGIKLAFEKTFFEKQTAYAIEYAKHLFDSFVILADERTTDNTPWVITNEILALDAPAALKINDQEKLLFFIDHIYVVNNLNSESFTEENSELSNNLKSLKNAINSSNDPYDIKLKLLEWAEIIESQEVSQGLNPTLLGNSSDVEKWTTDLNTRNAIKDLYKPYAKAQNKTIWLTAQNDKKEQIQITRYNRDRYTTRLYSPEKIQTTFLLNPAIHYGVNANDLTLNCSYLHIYHGNHEKFPAEMPTQIQIIHPLAGNIGQNDLLAKKFIFSSTGFNYAYRSSRLFGKSGITGTSLVPHILRLNEQGEIQEIGTKKFNYTVADSYKEPTNSFAKLIKENKNSFTEPDLINLFLIYFNTNASSLTMLNNLSNETQINNSGYTIKNGEFIGANNNFGSPAYNFILDAISTNKAPITILSTKNLSYPCWVEYKANQQFYCTVINGFINRLLIEDSMKDLKTILQTINPDFTNPYKIRINSYDSKNKKWIQTDAPGILATNIVTDETRIGISNIISNASPTELKRYIINSLPITMGEVGLIKYQQTENLGDFPQAIAMFEDGVKFIKKDQTLSAKIEMHRLLKLANKSKNADSILEEIYTSIIESNLFQQEPEKLIDVSSYLANELALSGKTKQTYTILKLQKDQAITDYRILKAAIEFCYISQQLLEKEKITPLQFKTDVEPVYQVLDKSIPEYFSKWQGNLTELLQLNLLWFKYQIAIKGLDFGHQQLFSNLPIGSTFALRGEELLKSQWNFTKINPLCYMLLVEKDLADAEIDKETELKQKINVSVKLVNTLLNNKEQEKKYWNNFPHQNAILMLEAILELQNNKLKPAFEKLKPGILAQEHDNFIYSFLANYTIIMAPTDFLPFVEAAAAQNLPHSFYRNICVNMVRIKNHKKAKALLSAVKEKVIGTEDLMADLEKILTPQ